MLNKNNVSVCSRLDGLNNGFLPGRSTKDAEFMEGGGDYELLLGNNRPYPSIRDQEYLQQSSLWGNKYISGKYGR